MCIICLLVQAAILASFAISVPWALGTVLYYSTNQSLPPCDILDAVRSVCRQLTALFAARCERNTHYHHLLFDYACFAVPLGNTTFKPWASLWARTGCTPSC